MSRHQHIIVSLRRTLRIQICIQSLPCFFPNLLGFCFEGVGLGSPTHEPPLPFSWSSFDPLPTASQISAAPHRNHKSLGLTNPHPRPSCLPSPSATAPPILTDDNDFRCQRRSGGTMEAAHRSWGRAGIWLLSCRRTAAATPTTRPAPHPRRSRLRLWTRHRAGGFQCQR